MIFGSVCSGIEAASVAWEVLGWRAAWYSEVDSFASSVLAHRFPSVPNHGDMNGLAARLAGSDRHIDILVGGTPCQSFSFAGFRGGLADSRGNLALEFIRLADALRPSWVVWENVPGVLSSGGGRDFGSILGALVECGYGCAWRVLDARFFGVPQRRRRVFLVGHLGDWRPAAAVLFEPESMCGDPASRRAPREESAAGAGCRSAGDGSARRLKTTAFDGRQSDVVVYGEQSGTLDTDGHTVAVLQQAEVRREGRFWNGQNVTQTLDAVLAKGQMMPEKNRFPVVFDRPRGSALCSTHGGLRRLTPRECERLQGFPDDWTLIPYRNRPAEECPDGPRYSAIGNSMAVPVMRWIGERIAMVSAA